jgi:DNA invertase Pin-like site-specific DNA recombinase
MNRLEDNIETLKDKVQYIDLQIQSKLIPKIFIPQGLRTIDDKGKENAISKMMITILGTVAEMERSRIRENQ